MNIRHNQDKSTFTLFLSTIPSYAPQYIDRSVRDTRSTLIQARMELSLVKIQLYTFYAVLMFRFVAAS